MKRRQIACGLMLLLSAALALVACRRFLGKGAAPRQGSICLRDLTSQTGIVFRHTDGGSGRYYLPEPISAGLALFDYDGDGWVDVYFVNGTPLKAEGARAPATNALYRNEGGLRFVDVTEEAGVGDTGYGLGAAVGDYDNDGDADLFVSNFGPNVLYQNNGDGTFTEVTEQAGVGGGRRVHTGACFLDIEGDGDLDLIVASYVDFSYETHVAKGMDGFPVYAGPLDCPALPDTLYRNNGDGTFTDVSAESGISSHVASSLGVICTDYNADGDTDIVVAGDDMADPLFDNDGAGKFEEMGLAGGLAYSADGKELGSRGMDCADYDNDGWLDLVVTSYTGQWVTLFKNLGDGSFRDTTYVTGAGAGSFRHVTWGTALVDFDNDGDRDLFIACGGFHRIHPAAIPFSAGGPRNIVLVNTGSGKFVDVSSDCGDGLSVEANSRGAAFDDPDNDGDIDAVILNSCGEPTVLRNDSAAGHHWIQIRLRGLSSNRDGVGARVTVKAGDLVQTDEVRSGRGYLSHFGSRLHFGLGTGEHVDRIEVRWVGGGVDVFTDLPVDQLTVLTQGTGRPNN